MKDYHIDRDRWNKLNIIEQMSNIGSEVGRSFNAKIAAKKTEEEQAVLRTLDLFDATTENLASKRSGRLREVLRARDQFLGIMYDDSATKSNIQGLNKYFLEFALAARLNK